MVDRNYRRYVQSKVKVYTDTKENVKSYNKFFLVWTSDSEATFHPMNHRLWFIDYKNRRYFCGIKMENSMEQDRKVEVKSHAR